MQKCAARLTSDLVCSAFDLLHYKGVDIARLGSIVPGLGHFSPRILERLNIEGLYKQHIIRQVRLPRLFATLPPLTTCITDPRRCALPARRKPLDRPQSGLLAHSRDVERSPSAPTFTPSDNIGKLAV